MKSIAIVAFGMAMALVLPSEADAQSVSSGIMSGPHSRKNKQIVQPVVSSSGPRVAAVSHSKPRVAAQRRMQPDPVTTGSIAAKPKN